MKRLLVYLLIIGAVVYNCITGILFDISPRNLEYVRQKSTERWMQLEFDVVGYDGFQWGLCFAKKYGGAKVWYVLRKKHSNDDIIYVGYLQRWGNEIHVYNLRAIDAVGPSRHRW